MGHVFNGDPMLCSGDTLYLLTKTLTENTQKYQVQEELVWNPSGRTVRVQSSNFWLFPHGPSLRELLLDSALAFTSKEGCPTAMLQATPLHLDSGHGFLTISKPSLGCPVITWMCKTKPNIFPNHMYVIDAILLLVKRGTNPGVFPTTCSPPCWRSQAFYHWLYAVLSICPFFSLLLLSSLST